VNIRWDSVAGPAVGAAIALLAGLLGIFIKGWVDRGEWRRDRRLQAYVDLGHRVGVAHAFLYRYKDIRAALEGQARDELYRVVDDLMRSQAQVELLGSKDIIQAAGEVVRVTLDHLTLFTVGYSGKFPSSEQFDAVLESMLQRLNDFAAKARENIGTS